MISQLKWVNDGREDMLIPNQTADESISTVSFISKIYLSLYTVVSSIVAWLFCMLWLNDDRESCAKYNWLTWTVKSLITVWMSLLWDFCGLLHIKVCIKDYSQYSKIMYNDVLVWNYCQAWYQFCCAWINVSHSATWSRRYNQGMSWRMGKVVCSWRCLLQI